jgi:hypothetical protein
VVGDVFVNGQSKDVWCNSKKPITELNMYGVAGGSAHLNDSQYATMSSCYVMYCRDDMYLLVRPNSECMPSSTSAGEYFLCE